MKGGAIGGTEIAKSLSLLLGFNIALDRIFWDVTNTGVPSSITPHSRPPKPTLINSYNKNKAHKELYHLLRLQHPSVPSALLQTVRDNALEAIKATKFKRVPLMKPTSGLRYDKRTMTLRGQQLTLSCIVCKHIKRTNRKKSRFCCKNCGHRTHADLNAARNVRDDYILSSTQNGTEEQASVNAPYVSGEITLA